MVYSCLVLKSQQCFLSLKNTDQNKLMTSPVEDPYQTKFDDLGVLINFFVFWNYHIPSPHISVPSILLNQYLVNRILSHASVDDNSDCEISHFSRFRKRFYDQVFELLDCCSGGVVVDSFQLHNTVKHCGLSSRRSRVQIPAGALHNRSIVSIDPHIISKFPPFPWHIPPSSTYSIISRGDFSLIISNLTSNG